MTSSLKVFSVLWGDKYPPAYVYALKEAVEKNLKTPHEFVCITTQVLPGIDTVNPWVSWPGWWQKLGLFCPQITSGPSLYFDLDTVITGPLDYLVKYTKHDLAAPANWAQSGHGGIQSSVLAWSGKWHEPYERFDFQKDSARLWGDQEFLIELRGDNFVKLPGVYSYKYHARGKGVPDDCSVLCFHGKPDPHEVEEKWLLQYTQTLRSNIK
ncbi:MAG: hypothetical protein D6711_14205 [Chloroflexi bacterium]|nr:MAG: hypothetical protein D6711_14205 [Chloroflexota bacterium]